LERIYETFKARTGEDFFDGPKSGPGSPEVSGSVPASSSSRSVPQFLQLLSASLPVLRRGARGDLVGVLQFELGLEPDEIFGPVTEARLTAFQHLRGITSEVAPSGKPYPLGVCGVRTWAAVFAVEADDDDAGGAVASLGLERAWREGSDDDRSESSGPSGDGNGNDVA